MEAMSSIVVVGLVRGWLQSPDLENYNAATTAARAWESCKIDQQYRINLRLKTRCYGKIPHQHNSIMADFRSAMISLHGDL